VTDRGNDLALVEAALFLSPQPMTRRGLAKLLGGVRLAYVDQLLEDLAGSYEDSVRGIELLLDDGRALLRVKAEYVERVAHLAPQQDIPQPILRTLAVIAYNHPMTQADVVRVRGNKAYGHVQELLERNLIRSEEQGRTFLLHVTAEFLRHFGLSSVEEFRFHAGASAEGQALSEDDSTADTEPLEEATGSDETDPEDNESASDALTSEEERSPAAPDAPDKDDVSPSDERMSKEEPPAPQPAATAVVDEEAVAEDVTSDPEVLQSDDPGGT